SARPAEEPGEGGAAAGVEAEDGGVVVEARVAAAARGGGAELELVRLGGGAGGVGGELDVERAPPEAVGRGRLGRDPADGAQAGERVHGLATDREGDRLAAAADGKLAAGKADEQDDLARGGAARARALDLDRPGGRGPEGVDRRAERGGEVGEEGAHDLGGGG